MDLSAVISVDKFEYTACIGDTIGELPITGTVGN